MNKRRYFFSGTCLIIFILLTYTVGTSLASGTSDFLTFDTVIRQWFYSIRTPWLTEVVKGITFMGNTKTIIILCIFFLVIPKLTKRFGLPVAAAAIVGSGINKIMKHVMLRPRPDVSLHLIEQGGWSFPSGHSISGLLMYGLLAWLIRRYVKDKRIANLVTVILTLLWIGIGLSRIYLGVHYPTDVLGGWTLGMVVMMITITVVEKVENRKSDNF